MACNGGDDRRGVLGGVDSTPWAQQGILAFPLEQCSVITWALNANAPALIVMQLGLGAMNIRSANADRF